MLLYTWQEAGKKGRLILSSGAKYNQINFSKNHVSGNARKIGVTVIWWFTKPPLTVLYEWIGYANQIEERNRLTTGVCKELCDELDKDGIRTCIPGKTCLVPYEKEFSFLDELSK